MEGRSRSIRSSGLPDITGELERELGFLGVVDLLRVAKYTATAGTSLNSTNGAWKETAPARYAELIGKVDVFLGSIPFAFLSIKPSPARWPLIDAIRSANALIHQEIRSRPNFDYIDVFEPMLGTNGRPRPELYAADGLHLSPDGYRLWAEQVLLHRDAIWSGPSRG